MPVKKPVAQDLISKAKRTRKAPEGMVNHIIAVTNYRITQDVNTVKLARLEADNVYFPKRNRLYQLYDDLRLDNHLSALLQARVEKVLNQRFKIINTATGKEDEARTKIFQAPWFYKLLQFSQEAEFYSHSLIELGNIITIEQTMYFDDVTLIPRRYVIPERGEITAYPTDITGLPYRNTPMMDNAIEVGDHKDLGLLFKAAIPSVWKKNAMICWSEYCEIFGMPLRVATTNSRQMKDLNRLDAALKNMGRAAYAVLQEGEKIEFATTPRGNSEGLYNDLVDRCNKEMSKLIIGSTMVLDDGSSRSQASVHERTTDEIIESDKLKRKYDINFDLIPKMVKLGFPLAGFAFDWDDREELSLSEQIKIDTSLLEFFDIDQQYFIEKYNIPITGIKETPVAPKPDTMPLPAKPEAKPKKDIRLSGKSASRDLRSTGRDLQSRPTKTILLSYGYPRDIAGRDLQSRLIKLADKKSEWQSIIDRVTQEIYDGKLTPEKLDSETVTKIANELMAAVKEGGLNINAEDISDTAYTIAEDWRTNIFVFSGFKTYNALRDASDALFDQAGQIRPFSDFKTDAQAIMEDYNINYLKAEYDYAVAASIESEKWQTIQKEKDVLPMLTYRTAGDDRVREEHQELEGICKPADDDFWNTYYPPNDWGCRCDVDQDDISATETDTDTMELPPLKPMFDNNPSKTGILFPDTHPYFDVPEQAAMRITRAAMSLIPE